MPRPVPLGAQAIESHEVVLYWKDLETAKAGFAGELTLCHFADQPAETGTIFGQ